MTKFILSASILVALSAFPALSFAQDAKLTVSSITYQTSDPIESDDALEDALNFASDATVAADKHWFRVVYREIDRKTILRNADSNAESRYLEQGDDLIEVIAPLTEQTDTSIRLEFEMGSGAMPNTRHTYSVWKPTS